MARKFKKILVTIAIGLGVVTGTCVAGSSTGSAASTGKTPSLVPSLSQPNWDQLSAEQRSVLKPLASDWPTMEGYRRKKWLGIAQRYSTMSAEEKLRVDQRMKDWASLSPEQRSQARANYKSLKQVTPDHKEDIKRKWEEYSQLPAEQRAQLKAEASRKQITKPLVSPSPPLAKKPLPTSPLLAPSPLPLAGDVKATDGVLPAPTGTQAPSSAGTKPTTQDKP